MKSLLKKVEVGDATKSCSLFLFPLFQLQRPDHQFEQPLIFAEERNRIMDKFVFMKPCVPMGTRYGVPEKQKLAKKCERFGVSRCIVLLRSGLFDSLC